MDDAFEALSPQVTTTVSSDPQAMTDVLQSHVIPGEALEVDEDAEESAELVKDSMLESASIRVNTFKRSPKSQVGSFSFC